jgi:hypothetical protein
VSDYDSLISPGPGVIATAESVRRRIRLAIQASPVPEDPMHSLNTLQWLLHIAPHADEALRIAALGHDIDRAAGQRRVSKADFEDFEEFKAAHARNSAQILLELLEECGVEKAVREEVFRLVCLHETGGDERSNLLRDADSLSFFEVNLPLYFARHGMEAALERSIWGYKRLSPELQGVVKEFTYAHERLNTLVQQVVAAVEE